MNIQQGIQVLEGGAACVSLEVCGTTEWGASEGMSGAGQRAVAQPAPVMFLHPDFVLFSTFQELSEMIYIVGGPHANSIRDMLKDPS
jgi:hypothetical protein